MTEYNIENIEAIKKEALKKIQNASNKEEITEIDTFYLGRKGLITSLLRNISNFPKEIRPQIGKKVNEVKIELNTNIKNAATNFETPIKDAHNNDQIDITLPGRIPSIGALHPITQVAQKIYSIFSSLGFEIVEGPEIETDYYNFEALNIPKNHPARDMQDTFYVSDNIVLRTHTSPIQIHVMEKQKPPICIIAPGKVYRCDSDLTHTPMFHQVEGLMVDKNITFGDLKGILTTFIHEMFDEQTTLKFRPSFFPFTEPSAEVDIRCVICKGKGCKVCSHTGWLEILGSGMVHPDVFEHVGYDTNKYSGFAFGMGIERIAMLKYRIDDIRKFFENDYRFLRQF